MILPGRPIRSSSCRLRVQTPRVRLLEASQLGDGSSGLTARAVADIERGFGRQSDW
jgi:hypothetical protein